MDQAMGRRPGPVGGRGRRVVVGVDGSPDSVAALRAAEWAAAGRGGTLVAVTAWGVPMIVPRAPAVVPDLHEAATTLLHEAIAEAFQGRSLVPIDTVVRAGRAAAVLVEEARDAELLVVGSRGHGGFAGLLLGSVSMACAMHAACPVLVIHDGTVPAPDAPSAGGRVVVGVGGSPAAATVLRVAAEAAAEMEAELVALAAWEDTTAFGDPELDVRAELEGAARRELEGAVDEVFGDARPPRLRAVLREGPAARVLVEESADADLVVVGRSGRSEFAGVLLGSIALPVAEHAASPVLVVPVVPQDAGHRHVPDGLAAARV